MFAWFAWRSTTPNGAAEALDTQTHTLVCLALNAAHNGAACQLLTLHTPLLILLRGQVNEQEFEEIMVHELAHMLLSDDQVRALSG